MYEVKVGLHFGGELGPRARSGPVERPGRGVPYPRGHADEGWVWMDERCEKKNVDEITTEKRRNLHATLPNSMTVSVRVRERGEEGRLAVSR